MALRYCERVLADTFLSEAAKSTSVRVEAATACARKLDSSHSLSIAAQSAAHLSLRLACIDALVIGPAAAARPGLGVLGLGPKTLRCTCDEGTLPVWAVGVRKDIARLVWEGALAPAGLVAEQTRKALEPGTRPLQEQGKFANFARRPYPGKVWRGLNGQCARSAGHKSWKARLWTPHRSGECARHCIGRRARQHTRRIDKAVGLCRAVCSFS